MAVLIVACVMEQYQTAEGKPKVNMIHEVLQIVALSIYFRYPSGTPTLPSNHGGSPKPQDWMSQRCWEQSQAQKKEPPWSIWGVVYDYDYRILGFKDHSAKLLSIQKLIYTIWLGFNNFSIIPLPMLKFVYWTHDVCVIVYMCIVSIYIIYGGCVGVSENGAFNVISMGKMMTFLHSSLSDKPIYCTQY